jgi:Arc/MetJ-type ribon-helix-helix transcriptional regulator
MANLSVYRGVKLTKELAEKLEAAAAEKGFSSPSAFIRSAIENELTSRKPVFDESEQRIVATIDRLAQEMRKISTGQQALFAFVDSLTKTLLTCVPEPSGEAYAQALARAKARYERFIKNVGMNMAGDSRAALAELVDRTQ